MVTPSVFRKKKQKPYSYVFSYRGYILIIGSLTSIVLLSIGRINFRAVFKSKKKEEIASIATKDLLPWKEGFLDIHHIHAGVNVATFAIFPDGTTMLIDCGDLDIKTFQEKYGKQTEFYPKLDVVSPYPQSSKTTGEWVIEYIHHFWPHKPTKQSNRKKIDYMMITHFHQDHIGSIYKNGNQAKGIQGDYIRTGIVEVGDEIDFNTIIDRGYPNYDFPFDLEKHFPFLELFEFHSIIIATRFYKIN